MGRGFLRLGGFWRTWAGEWPFFWGSSETEGCLSLLGFRPFRLLALLLLKIVLAEYLIEWENESRQCGT